MRPRTGVAGGGPADNKNARLLLADCYLRMGQFKKVVEARGLLEPPPPTTTPWPT